MDVLIEGRCRHLDDGAGMAGRDPGWTTRPPVNNFGALRPRPGREHANNKDIQEELGLAFEVAVCHPTTLACGGARATVALAVAARG